MMQIGSALQATAMDGASLAEKLKMSKLEDSAHQFEAMLIGQMMKPMQFGAAPGSDEDPDNSGGASDTIRSMGTEAMSKSIANSGGFGIAKQIIRQVTAEHTASETKQHSTKV